ncbi:MAG: tetratricopeptide repeat protein [Chthonomonadales bacterium]
MPGSLHAAELTRARDAMRSGQAVTAIAILKQIEPEMAARSDFYELMGMAQTVAGNNTAARDAFRKATRIEPGKFSVHYNYAVFLLKIGDEDEATEENQTALMIEPGNANAVALQAKIRTRIQDRDYVSEEGFEAVGAGKNPMNASGRWTNLQCPTCGHKNFMTARVCKNCQSYIPEMDEIIPVE